MRNANPERLPSGVSDEPSRGASERLQRFFERLATSGFFGKVTVSFQNGKVGDVRIEQTRKLEDL